MFKQANNRALLQEYSGRLQGAAKRTRSVGWARQSRGRLSPSSSVHGAHTCSSQAATKQAWVNQQPPYCAAAAAGSAATAGTAAPSSSSLYSSSATLKNV